MKRAGTAALGGLCLATAAYSVLQSLVVPALGVFQRQLDTTPSGAAWLLTAFLLSASISTPVLGRLADVHGKRRILLAVLTAMSLGALISAIASALPVMVAGRVVQGLGGAVFPLCFALVRDHLPVPQRPRAFVMISTVMSVGGAAGTITAGPILSVLSSRWLFLIPAVISALAMIPVALLLPPGKRATINTRIDWYGAALLATWLGLLLFGISRFPSPGGVWPLTGAALLAPVWWRSQRRAPQPLVDLRTLALPTVRATNAATLLLGFGMFGSWMVIPLMIVDRFAASPTVVGLAMLPTAIGNLLIMPIHRRLTARQGPRAALAAGIATAGLSYLALAIWHQTPAQVCLGILVMGAGIGLAFSAVGALVVEAVPSEQTGVSAAVNTVMRTVGGSLGAAVGGSVLTWSPGESSYVTVLLLYAAALGGALLCAVRVPRPVIVAGEPGVVRTGAA
ncbi:MFS transporter [Actinoplanes sp. NEAU-A12]|uniref:MFS transporter n=1 Tax=Actinoplanes sandaracinus TaxID=3045177 RepID=A0ABT6X1C4_9ACTN|nr:MFS transporter [Actinoplanes sandaracinus]MDI6105827.1 MFS transporter [Actinoplanes sandaracinus]